MLTDLFNRITKSESRVMLKVKWLDSADPTPCILRFVGAMPTLLYIMPFLQLFPLVQLPLSTEVYITIVLRL